MTFAETYLKGADELLWNPKRNCAFACRGLAMAKEMTAVHCEIGMSQNGVSVFSHKDHRVVPIRFVLAELCYLLSGSNDLELIASYSAAMKHYSNDGKTIDGAYGYRLMHQLPAMIKRLKMDGYTRQACGVIFNEGDATTTQTHMPCNVFLQVLWRQPLISLHVASRSSDFVTGFSIDTLHWQFLLRMIANELETVAEKVVYDIATLHIYRQDMDVVEQWPSALRITGTYEHFLKTDMSLSSAMAACRAFFTTNMSVVELCLLLGLDDASIHTAGMLDGLFKQHKNKLVR
jgi:thymidylate synthase